MAYGNSWMGNGYPYYGYPTAYAYSAGPSPFCGGCCQNV